MNKKCVLSLVLSFALVFTTVFAGAGSVFATEASVQDAEVKSEVLEVKMPKFRTKANVVEFAEPLNVKTMLYSNSSAPEYYGWDFAPNTYVLTTVTPKNSGLMYMEYKSPANGYPDVVGTYLLVNDSCQMTEEGLAYEYYESYRNNIYAGDDKVITNQPIPVKAGQEYQFLFVASQWNEDVVTMEARAKVYTTGQRTLSQGTTSSKYVTASGYQQDGSVSSTYFKVKPTKSGVMTVYLKRYGYSANSGYVTLYNSSKKARSEKVAVIDGKAKFGVKKNTTYYLKVNNCVGSMDNCYKFGIKYTMIAATDRSISSKSKAKSIYRKGDTVKSLFVAADSNSVDYYKMKVTTARKTKITVKAEDVYSGYITMKLYNSKGKVMKSLKIPANHEGYISSTKLAKGTYYVKLTKSKKASGRYSIKWTY